MAFDIKVLRLLFFLKQHLNDVRSRCPTEGWNIVQGSIYDVKADKCMQKIQSRLISVNMKTKA